MHGPSALPLLVELAATAIVLTAALARRPLARALRTPRSGPTAASPHGAPPRRDDLAAEDVGQVVATGSSSCS